MRSRLTAMHHLGRFPLLSTALLVAACSVAPQASAPAPAATPPSASHVAVEPTARSCAGIEAYNAPALEVRIQRGFSELSTQIVAARGSDGSPVAPPDTGDPIVHDWGHVPGAMEYRAVIVEADGFGALTDMTVTATLTLDGAAEPLPVAVRGDELRLRLPDVDAPARLEIGLEFRDDCFTLQMTGAATFLLGSAATVAACPIDPDEGLAPYLEDILAQPILVDGKPFQSALSSAEPLWSRGVVSTDYGTHFPAWDRAADPVVGEPGSTVAVRAATHEVVLRRLRSEVYRRADARAEAETGATPRVVRESAAVPQPDGTLRLHLPDEPGRYVTYSTFEWTSRCATGVSIVNVSIDVE